MCTNNNFHPLGMLDRDQRTALSVENNNFHNKLKKRIFNNKFLNYFYKINLNNNNNNLNNNNNTNVINNNKLNNNNNNNNNNLINNFNKNIFITSEKDTVKRHRKQCYFNLWRKPFDYLVIYLYIWIISINTISTAPVIMEKQPKWINPCNPNGSSPTSQNSNIEPLTASDLKRVLNVIQIQCSSALNEANRSTEDYIQFIWKVGKDDHHQNWKHREAEWLYPSEKPLPKHFGEKIPEKYAEYLRTGPVLESENFAELLLETYERFQRLAVGLEQVVADKENDKQNMIYDKTVIQILDKLFDRAEDDISSVLCEVQTGIMEINAKTRPDVDRKIMPDNVRLNNNERKLRDWLIIREYVNHLEFIKEAFEILHERISKENN